MVGRTKHQNAADRERIEILLEIGCIPCLLEGYQEDPTIQHVTSCGRRHEDQHQHTYPSCPWHHQGISKFDSKLKTRKAFGPSFALEKKAFAKVYGTEDELVDIASALVRSVKSARRNGWFMVHKQFVNLTRDLHREIVQGERPNPRWKSVQFVPKKQSSY